MVSRITKRLRFERMRPVQTVKDLTEDQLRLLEAFEDHVSDCQVTLHALPLHHSSCPRYRLHVEVQGPQFQCELVSLSIRGNKEEFVSSFQRAFRKILKELERQYPHCVSYS